MRRYENPVIVLGGDLAGLGVERNLGRNEITVYSILEKKHIAMYSKGLNEKTMSAYTV